MMIVSSNAQYISKQTKQIGKAPKLQHLLKVIKHKTCCLFFPSLSNLGIFPSPGIFWYQPVIAFYQTPLYIARIKICSYWSKWWLDRFLFLILHSLIKIAKFSIKSKNTIHKFVHINMKHNTLRMSAIFAGNLLLIRLVMNLNQQSKTQVSNIYLIFVD